METITFQGNIEQIFNTKNGLEQANPPKEVETRVYVIDTFNIKKIDWDTLTDEEFITLAEEDGNIYTLESFQEAFNSQDVNTEIDVIRFINVETN